MGERTKIAWCDDTFNPCVGCEPVSAGCANCYAAAQAHRWGKDFSQRTRTSATNWKKPLAWNKRPWVCDTCVESYAEQPFACCGTAEFHRRRVFCGSMCDWLDDAVPVEWLADLLDLIRQTPNLQWLLLTKMPENWQQRFADVCNNIESSNPLFDWLTSWLDDGPPPYVWIGATVENQPMADQRITALLRIPAAKRFLSVEPMLGPVNIALGSAPWWQGKLNPVSQLDWVIVGGESGQKARPCNVEWIRGVVGQCKAARVPVFVKQLETVCYKRGELTDFKGADPSEWPADLRVREWPKE